MKKLFLMSIIALGLLSCNKKEAVELKFNVEPTKTSYKVNDTVTFKVSGNPDQLIFYSGEEGRQYIYKDRLFAESDEITLEFATHKRYGTAAAQPNTISLFASQKYNGAKTTFSEQDWVDISSAFTFSPFDGAENYTPSGVVNLLQLSNLGLNIDKEKPIYFAFKYQGLSNASTQPRIFINKFDIKTKTKEGKVIPVLTLATGGWSSLKIGNTAVDWIIDGGSNTTRLRNQGAAANAPANESWVMTKGFFLTSVIPDRGVALKNMSTRIGEYNYVFTKAGTYKVTFVASNENVYGGDKVIKELEIVVNP
ncbi:hypothetical protein Pedsa_0062 [Pseudopedobacter saltans DSM 12145]|uniref:DUF5017 domain-containing protein n=1 Tax=Pseudopedobacter saltans (strain ATCC 51119 / DSM 12145 / JCM 21818 / CCUG 39354 / LMG 10337 / NBRC 100064 / NCIMB 13643) TaxID=762903 RepID=F0SC65_PSESL|nr:DUF5017 domain-containing protein [Pseudopedobacter saltans]ADY50650.1 hypothetical protein Pedsa_0062 [Pseudopedobacter saltans DSM 12145]